MELNKLSNKKIEVHNIIKWNKEWYEVVWIYNSGAYELRKKDSIGSGILLTSNELFEKLEEINSRD